MIPKTWFTEDYILIGLTRQHIFILILLFLVYTLVWYLIGWGVKAGLFRRFRRFR